MEPSLRLAELVPRRSGPYVALLLGGLLAILLFGALYAVGQWLGPLTTDGRVAAFDLDSEGSLANWFSVLILIGCAQAALGASLLVDRAAVRRRSGWLFVALVWLGMSADEGSSLHEAFKEFMTYATGTRLLGDGSIYWVIPYLVVLSAAGLFIFSEVRRLPDAAAALVSAGVSYVLAVSSQLELILRGMGPVQIWIEESCELLGHLLVLLTVALYARALIHRGHRTGRVRTPACSADQRPLSSAMTFSK